MVLVVLLVGQLGRGSEPNGGGGGGASGGGYVCGGEGGGWLP